MQSGLDAAALVDNEQLLCELCDIDPRGALFSQSDCATALGEMWEESGMLKQFEVDGMDEASMAQMTAYLVRVMCAHVRQSYDNTSSHSEHPLANVFARVRGTTTVDLKKQRRDERLRQRQTPFVAFRDREAQPAEEDDDDDEPTTVAAYFCPKQRKGVMLLSDGTTQFADKYERGDRGFVTCVWHHPEYWCESEVPNMFLRDGRVLEAPATTVMRRPASRKKKDEEEAEEEDTDSVALVLSDSSEKGEEEEEDRKDEEANKEDADKAQREGGTFFKLAAERKGSTLVVCSEGRCKDKAQILHVTLAACARSALSPRQVCEKVADHMCSLDRYGWPLLATIT